MHKTISTTKVSFFATLIFLLTLSGSNIAHAENSLDLCPIGFDEGLITTGYVDCHRRSSTFDRRSDAELARLQREAVCLATPNAQLTQSQIRASGDRFFAELTCRVNRPVPAGTVLCPDNTEEVSRAFDTLVCKYFGTAETSAQAAQAVVTAQSTDCVNNFNGRVLKANVFMELFNNNGEEEVDFYTTFVSCAREIAPTDIIECPYSFYEIDDDENSLSCFLRENGFETLAEAQQANQQQQSICTTTTDGLGSVEDSVAASSSDTFISRVTCEVNIARYGEFSDQSTIRACDASCTEEIQQARVCLNGGQIGRTGCTAASTQNVERRCNTGPDPDGLCPLVLAPSTVVPLILLDEEEEN